MRYERMGGFRKWKSLNDKVNGNAIRQKKKKRNVKQQK